MYAAFHVCDACRQHLSSLNMKLIKLILCLFCGAFVVHARDNIKCIENGRFYRDPNRPTQKQWTTQECSKYYLCLDGDVFDFRCSNGLHFDIERQICDAKDHVDNCDATTDNTSRPPEKADNCLPGHQSCNDNLTCLPADYFCDGSIDCPDGSDESNCSPDSHAATPCNVTQCRLPHCFCSKNGTSIPNSLNRANTPQMILLTFDDAINYENWDIFQHVLHPDYLNPNGCPIRATFFISHQFNNYHQTQKMWNRGHEIAVHSITHRAPEQWWSLNATLEDYFDEMVGQANIIHKYAGVRLSEIRGMRVPFLRVGWNRQFLMMKEFGFVYDSSIVAPFSDMPYWPYTLDYRPPHKCTNCPTRSYRGVWEMVVNQIENEDYTCAMVDACPLSLTGDQVYKMLVHNFKRHYTTNRAPFGLSFHASWFKKSEYLNAFKRFVEEVLKQDDVWFVTNSQAISWMQTPTAIDDLMNFAPWGCSQLFSKQEIACNVPNVCKLYSKSLKAERYFHTCFKCPAHYPWIRNEFGID